jgi:L-threonylcarbamoyladenylate synthase
LTLVVATRARLPWVTAGLDSIALREPAHEFARALIRRVGPLAAPSANRSGRPSPTSVAHVLTDLRGEVSLVVDGGDLEHGLESTVVDVRGHVPVMLRPGAVTLEDIRAALGGSVETATPDDVVRSPGMKYRHYSPRAELWLYVPAADLDHGIPSSLQEDAAGAIAAGRRVGVIARTPVDAAHFKPLPSEARAFGRTLFAWLRELDELGVDLVLVEGIGRAGIGRAVMDRLERAATRVIGASPAREHHGVVA